jgi:hypothetical protein
VLLLLPACLFAANLPMARANDSSAAIGIGGLELTRNEAISMDAEDLYVSEKEIRVRYRFTNRTARDVETLVSFPVPDLPGGLGSYLGDRPLPDYRELQFQTTVDGAPVQLDYVERAMIGGRDVTRRLAALAWPMRWDTLAFEQDGMEFINKLTPAQRDAFIREGLLKQSAELGALAPAWNLVTHVTRRQVFPAGKTVEVTHRYVPLAGGSVGGNLDPENRKSDYFAEKTRQYCIDRAVMAGFDRRQGSALVGERPFYMEHWISYILSSGRNWRGPIGDFRLVVDKGKAENIVSFCMDGVRKISPTRFEVRKRNFEPRTDLDVLVISWGMPED